MRPVRVVSAWAHDVLCQRHCHQRWRRRRAPNDSQLFVHDLTDGSTVLASTGPLGAANEGVSEFTLSGDGKRAAFSTFASNFVGSQPGQLEVFMRDLAAGTTSHVSLRDGAMTGGRLGSSTPSLNLDGSCVAFQSTSDDLVAGGYGPDYIHVFLHAISAACPPVTEPPTPRRRLLLPRSRPIPEPHAPPVVSDLRMERDRFRVTKAAGSEKQQAKRGTAFLFDLSEPADVAITIERKGRCKTKRCRGALSASSREGSNRVPFGGRSGKKALKPGEYQATMIATDACRAAISAGDGALQDRRPLSGAPHPARCAVPAAGTACCS